MPRGRVGELDLHYEDEGAGEPVLLLMGLGGELGAWSLVRPELVRRFRCILIDNRDAGRSAQAGAPYALADMAADALGVMDALGIERFHVVGASMGGLIAQHLALAAPARVATLVLAATWVRTDAFLRAVLTGWRLLVERLDAGEFLAIQAPWAFTPRFLEQPSPEVRALLAARREQGLVPSASAFQRQLDACLAHDLAGLLPILRTPALVLTGEDDILTPPRYGRAVAAALARAEMQLLPASGHACFLETPKPFAERVIRFLGHHRLAA